MHTKTATKGRAFLGCHLDEATRKIITRAFICKWDCLNGILTKVMHLIKSHMVHAVTELEFVTSTVIEFGMFSWHTPHALSVVVHTTHAVQVPEFINSDAYTLRTI